MNNKDKNNTNKKKSTSEGMKIVKFIVGLIAIYAVGVVVGIGTAFIEDVLRSETLVNSIIDVLKVVIPVIYVAVNVIIFLVGMSTYAKTKKMLDGWDGEDEEVPIVVEKKLNNVTVVYNIIMVCNCLFFGAMVEISNVPQGVEADIPFSAFSMISLLLFLAMNLFVGKLVIDLIKRINPERKSVSLFEKDFEKQWEDSSDEAQKMILYKAGYAAYKATNIACSVMWGVTLMAQLIYKTGVFPMLCVCIIWGILIGVNSYTQAKLESGSY